MDKEQFIGDVVWFDPKKGYGFIGWQKNNVKQQDMFVHFSDVICEGFKTLNKEQKVSFSIGTNKHGNPKAIEVTILRH